MRRQVADAEVLGSAIASPSLAVLISHNSETTPLHWRLCAAPLFSRWLTLGRKRFVHTSAHGEQKSLLTKTVPIANGARSTFGRPSDYSCDIPRKRRPLGSAPGIIRAPELWRSECGVTGLERLASRWAFWQASPTANLVIGSPGGHREIAKSLVVLPSSRRVRYQAAWGTASRSDLSDLMCSPNLCCGGRKTSLEWTVPLIRSNITFLDKVLWTGISRAPVRN
jgi:hypothetical protein